MTVSSAQAYAASVCDQTLEQGGTCSEFGSMAQHRIQKEQAKRFAGLASGITGALLIYVFAKPYGYMHR